MRKTGEVAMEEKIPRVFISYSWSASEHVHELAERLVANGVDVVFDKWNLQAGQDKYAFMERSVNDSEIDKVLLICDKSYAEKANSRAGGVGDETMIISPEIYENTNQEKFLPILFEVDENNQPYLPSYLKSRIYFDLSTEADGYEIEYEKLLRNIYDRPLYKKPPLGNKPAWLENDIVDLSKIRDLIKQIRGDAGDNQVKVDFLLRNTTDAFLAALSEFQISTMNDTILITRIEEMKPLRDLYVDFVEALIYSALPLVDTLTSFFEEIYNETRGFADLSINDSSYIEHYDFFIWETFIVTTAILYHYEKYTEIHGILSHTYFLRNSSSGDFLIQEQNYCIFKKPLRALQALCKEKCNQSDFYSLAGHMLVHREKKPLLTTQAISRADILLYQLSCTIKILNSQYSYSDWFPASYQYFDGGYSMWTKLKSKKYCQNILPLFGVNTISELKERLAVSVPNRNIRYRGSGSWPPNILSYLGLGDIATLN